MKRKGKKATKYGPRHISYTSSSKCKYFGETLSEISTLFYVCEILINNCNIVLNFYYLQYCDNGLRACHRVRLNAYWRVYTSLKSGKHCTRFDTPIRITDISVISEYSACSILLVFKKN